jgi:fructokinase
LIYENNTQMFFKAQNKCFIGVDLGGTKTEVAVLDADHHFLLRERLPTPQHDYADIIANIAELVNFAKQRCHLSADHPVGIGIPGCIDPSTQVVRGANTQVLNGQPFHADLQKALGCEVFIENDANCLALSEVVDGASLGSRVSFAAILGTGCGAGITLGTSIWAGRNALAGEWGHNPLPWPTSQELETPACWCGQQGCIETWVSGPALAADHLRITHQALTPEQIVQSMLQGDTAAIHTWQRYVDRLARSLAHIVNTLDPDVIVLGGGMSRIDALYASLATDINQYTFTRPITTPIRAAVHGDSSGVRGAAWLTRHASV